MSIDIKLLPPEAQKALETFQEFKIQKYNDSGANGFVMIGYHKVLKKEVAIKIYYHDENEINQEPSLIASIDHENVLKIYDARKVEKDCSFYMMQAANEGDLLNFSDNYYFSTIYSHKLLCQLLSGLASLHCKEKNLVHRDLKLENLLIHDKKMIIADIGSVRKVDEQTGVAPASKHSILYRPLEAFGNKAFFDFSSDVYQAGIIGNLLFGGFLSNDLLLHLNDRELKKFKQIEKLKDDYNISTYIDSCIEKKIKSRKLLDWKSLPFYVSEKVKRVLKRTVSKHGKRYESVSEFLQDLLRVKIGMPNWIYNSKGYELRNWKKNDYLLLENKGEIILKKKKHSTSLYRVDNRVKSKDFTSAYKILKKKIGIS